MADNSSVNSTTEKPVAQLAPDHVKQIDGLRALAILMVFIHHAFDVPLLWSGVDLFFILSGFLITQILVRDSSRFTFPAMARRFYLRRAQRILPAYCLFMLAAVPLVPVAWKHLWPWYAFFLQNIPVALSWVPIGALTPLWSLGVENQFYLVWPLVVFFVPRRWLAPSMVGLLVAEPVLRFVGTPMFQSGGPIYALTPFRLDALAAGALLALTLPHVQSARAAAKFVYVRRLAPVLTFAAAILLAALTLHYPWFRRTANAATFNCVAYSLNIVCFGSLFVWAWFSRGWLARALSSRVLGGLGRISYMFYLSHIFFLYYATKVVHSHAASVALAFAATTVFSTLSWRLVEKPILNWRRKPGKPTQVEIANAQAAA